MHQEGAGSDVGFVRPIAASVAVETLPVAGVPNTRLSEFADVASAMAFLASSTAGYVMGQVLVVNENTVWRVSDQ